MLLRALIFLSIIPTLAAGLPYEQTFRVRLYEGYPKLAEEDKRELAELQAVAGHEFHFGSREQGWSVSGVVSEVAPFPQFSGHVNVRNTQTTFKNEPIINALLNPRWFTLSNVIHSFYLRIRPHLTMRCR